VRACHSRSLLLVPIALFTFTMMVVGTAMAKPATFCVNPGGTAGCFAKIQDAVDATGKSGSVINVAVGGYFDNVVIPKTRVTINADPNTAIFGITTDPILTVAAGAKVTINNLQFQDTFTNSSCIESRGSLTMNGIAVFLCSGMRGAAIHQIGGKLTILNSVIDGNEATENGGCLAMEGGKLSLQNTDFTNCIAGGDGGALWLSNTKANIVGIAGEAHEPTLNIMSNQASGSGGGIFATGGKLTIEAMILSDNLATAGNGGGIESMGPLTITNSVIENNTSRDDGGGILAMAPGKLSVINSSVIANNSDEGDGGGIAAETTFNLLNDTLFGNRSSQRGGAIFALGSGKIGSLTIDGNHSVQSNGGGIDIASGSVKITNTIMSLNTAPMEFAQDCGGSFVSQGFNLIFDTTGCAISGQTGNNIIGQDPNLGATQPFDVKIVQEPSIGSPVLGAGGHCPKTDEVFHSRPKTRCDIGAFESP
jgi:predicted outer membrane repeat protein